MASSRTVIASVIVLGSDVVTAGSVSFKTSFFYRLIAGRAVISPSTRPYLWTGNTSVLQIPSFWIICSCTAGYAGVEYATHLFSGLEYSIAKWMTGRPYNLRSCTPNFVRAVLGQASKNISRDLSSNGSSNLSSALHFDPSLYRAIFSIAMWKGLKSS